MERTFLLAIHCLLPMSRRPKFADGHGVSHRLVFRCIAENLSSLCCILIQLTLNRDCHTLGGPGQGRIVEMNVPVRRGRSPVSEQPSRNMEALARS